MRMYYNIYWYKSYGRYFTDIVPFMWKWMAYVFGWVRWTIDRRVYSLYIKDYDGDFDNIMINNSLGKLVYAIER